MNWIPASQPPPYGQEVLLWLEDSAPNIAVGKRTENPDCPESDYWEPSENLIAEVIGAFEDVSFWQPLPPKP